jgi:hypothetical protein
MENLMAYGIIVLMGIGCFLIGFCLATILYYCNGVHQRRDLMNIERSILLLHRESRNQKCSDSQQKRLEIVPLVGDDPPGDNV